MGSIEIPSALKKRLPKGSFVDALLRKVEVYAARGMDLFPNYTDHGVPHVNHVLATAAKLIPRDTLKDLSPLAVEILVVSCAVHDLGMFVRTDGLQQLIFSAMPPKVDHLDKQTWRELWDDYYREIKHFSTARLEDTFGTDPSGAVEPPKVPADSIPVNPTVQDRRVYGEFVRRDHERLSRDMVIHGFFGAETTPLIDPATWPRTPADHRVRDLIGLIAQSHGMALRDTEDYLKNHHVFSPSPTSPLAGVPVFYLMALLRLADYLDAGSERAPYELPRMQALRSATSTMEFEWNGAVVDNLIWDFDERRVVVQADPKSGAVFRRIHSWITAVQEEAVCP